MDFSEISGTTCLKLLEKQAPPIFFIDIKIIQELAGSVAENGKDGMLIVSSHLE